MDVQLGISERSAVSPRRSYQHGPGHGGEQQKAGRQAGTRLCRSEPGSSSPSRVQAAFLRLISPNLNKGYSAAHSNLGLNLRSVQKAGQASQVDGLSRVTMDKCIHYSECNVFSAQQGAEKTFGGWSGSALGALSSRAQHAAGT